MFFIDLVIEVVRFWLQDYSQNHTDKGLKSFFI